MAVYSDMPPIKQEESMGNIINKVTYENYTHWIEYFIQRVLTESNVDYGEVVITDIDYGKRIFLSIDGEEYIVRTYFFQLLHLHLPDFQLCQVPSPVHSPQYFHLDSQAPVLM